MSRPSLSPPSPGTPLTILGAGAWGTALAEAAAHAGSHVTLWARDPLVADDIRLRHQNRKRYPEATLHGSITATHELHRALPGARQVVIAVPSEANPALAAQVGPLLTASQTLILSSKGFRESDGALLSEVWQDAAPACPLLVLTGPTFAAELLAHQHTACLLAGGPAEARAEGAAAFSAPWFRVYEGEDLIGAQVGGALKNVMAIAAGLLAGLELGYNARAALLTRGLREMGRLSVALGGQEETIYGLAGLGDLLLTATSTLSRNYRFGQRLGQGVTPEKAKLELGTVEGILAARIATVKAQSLGVELAIIAAVDGVLHGDVAPLQALEYLMLRPRERELA